MANLSEADFEALYKRLQRRSEQDFDALYEKIEYRLEASFWAGVGRKAAAFSMFLIEYGCKGAAAAWPFIFAWLKKSGYIDV